MHPFVRAAKRQKTATVELIERLARCESPSGSPEAVNEFVDLLVNETKDIARAERSKTKGFGDVLRLNFDLAPASSQRKRILALGHSDTVWPKGTLPSMPVKRSKGRLWGPGVLDMKSGLAFFVTAVRILKELDISVPRKLVLLVVPDEEVGSPESRSITEREAGANDVVLVLEPGTGLAGKLKTARKGVGRYRVSVQGRAAHAGVDFENGASAILEAARQIERMSALTDPKRGITLNPGVIRGGTRSNVVAAEAQIEVDLRAVSNKDANAIDRKLKGLRAVDKRCTLLVEGGLNRPPMERTRAIGSLFGRAQAVAAELGTSIEESATGGGSDGNFTAALGIPTLDGLGGVGEGAHASNESILLDRVVDRVALLAGLIAKL
jgi:glutamate carboxypeptidase